MALKKILGLRFLVKRAPGVLPTALLGPAARTEMIKACNDKLRSESPRPEVINLFFMLNPAEH